MSTVTVGYDARGKRITRKASAKTKTEGKDKLKEMVRDLDDGLPIAASGYTVADAGERMAVLRTPGPGCRHHR